MFLSVVLIDDDGQTTIAAKTFTVNFSEDDPRVWFATAWNWLAARVSDIRQPYLAKAQAEIATAVASAQATHAESLAAAVKAAAEYAESLKAASAEAAVAAEAHANRPVVVIVDPPATPT